VEHHYVDRPHRFSRLNDVFRRAQRQIEAEIQTAFQSIQCWQSSTKHKGALNAPHQQDRAKRQTPINPQEPL
jgi:hypothetical protein